ncbi:MAG TPA: oxygenase MpaB family protein, partial [Solirubrobacteraceae bacterium]|nr:oxygenase MpaB family protein [Solirubrobacteraceae bacterium]
AYAWVHATLIDTYVAGQASFGQPMSRAETERFYQEYRGLGRLIGVREDDLPRSWAGFREYFERMTGQELVRTQSVDRVLGAIRQAPPPLPIPEVVWRAFRLPAAQVLRLGGLGLMSSPLRQRLAIPWSAADEAQFRALAGISRSLTPVLPMSLRVTGPAQLRWRRDVIASGPLGESRAA